MTDGIQAMATAQPAAARRIAAGGEGAAARAAEQFEAAFLAEMLRHAGLARPPALFGGGAGEDRFASFLVRAYAERIAEAGGVGLAEHVADALRRAGAA